MKARASIYRWGLAGKNFLSRLRDAHRYGIDPQGLVLDLGSGQNPHPRANVLCDRFVTDSSERACGGGLLIDRPLVLADATATPFPDDTFDFIFCSHLLEHMDDPVRLLTEMQRIGKAGYIETPSKVYEKLWGWDFHQWFVFVEGDRLVLEPKERVVFDDDLHGWFGTQIEREDVWRFVIPRLTDLELLTRFVWKESIQYEIRNEDGPKSISFRAAAEDLGQTIEVLQNAPRPALRWTQKVKRILSRWHRRRSDPKVQDLFDRLRCPGCRSLLDHQDGTWTCTGCGSTYSRVNDVPVLLARS